MTVTASELRGQIRDWRRGRATVSVGELVTDYYSGIFAALVLSAMVGNALLTLSNEADALCVGQACRATRSWLPWLVVSAVMAAAVLLSRLVGPVFVSPAQADFVLSTPVDRADWLRPRLRQVCLTGAVAGLAAALPITLLAGLDPLAVALTAGAGVAGGIAAVTVAAAAQGRARRWLGVTAALVLVGVWVAMAGLVSGSWPELTTDRQRLVAPVVLVGLLTLGGWAFVRARARLRTLHAHELARGGALTANLSGALAALDLALGYDVVIAHQSRRQGSVTPVRGGPGSQWTVAWRELVRLRRAPRRLLPVVGAVIAPYVAAQAGIGAVTVLVAVLALWPAIVPLLLGLRVLARGRSLLRMLPGPDWQARGLTLLLPATVSLLAGLALTPAVHRAIPLTWGQAAGFGACCGLGALAAATRWMSARPPDYRSPLVATPAGSLPPSALAAVARGFDIALLVSAPLLILPPSWAITTSLALTLIVVATCIGRSE